MAAVWSHLQSALLVQRGYLFPWVPVALAAGIAVFFHLKTEPSVMLLVAAAGVAVVLMAVASVMTGALMPVVMAAALVLAGLSIAGARAHQVAGPVIGWRYYGPVEGRIVAIDRSGSDAVRLTLDRVHLRDMPPTRVPTRVRISLHGAGGDAPVPGLRVMTTAHLAPPNGPVEPGGFDFQRHAWFQQIGAVGYTRVPVLALAPPSGAQPLFRARMALSAHVQDVLPSEVGAFAAAIMTGDRSGMGQDTLSALRVSNLAHLLAISGLHMGLLAGFVFAAFRIGFALWPWLALRAPVKKMAAGLALMAAAGYLALSGGNVATERAFVMVAVVLIAVMFDRRAMSLRAVALAAVIVLTLRPEALMGPGFQMSFAATTALIAVFGWINRRDWQVGPRWLRPVMAVVISSFVAGAATAPVAAAHFNQIAHFGLIANLASVPLMGVLVMPAAVIAACLLPLGLEWIALWVMGLGLRWILGVAHHVSGLEGARGMVVSPGDMVLPMIALGALVVILWQGRARVIGVVPMVLGFVLWGQGERPDVLISDTGVLVGVMTEQGRALSKARSAGFVAMNWLENDGDSSLQEAAAQRWGEVGKGRIAVRALAGKRALATLTGCSKDEWLVLTTDPPEGLDCTVIHPGTLRETGAMALYDRGGRIEVVTARQITGARLWNTR